MTSTSTESYGVPFVDGVLRECGGAVRDQSSTAAAKQPQRPPYAPRKNVNLQPQLIYTVTIGSTDNPVTPGVKKLQSGAASPVQPAKSERYRKRDDAKQHSVAAESLPPSSAGTPVAVSACGSSTASSPAVTPRKRPSGFSGKQRGTSKPSFGHARGTVTPILAANGPIFPDMKSQDRANQEGYPAFSDDVTGGAPNRKYSTKERGNASPSSHVGYNVQQRNERPLQATEVGVPNAGLVPPALVARSPTGAYSRVSSVATSGAASPATPSPRSSRRMKTTTPTQGGMFRQIRPDTVWEMMGVVMSVIVIATVMTILLLMRSYSKRRQLRGSSGGTTTSPVSSSSRATTSRL